MKKWIIGIFALAILGSIFYNVMYYTATQDTLTVTIQDKERITESDGEGNVSSKYLVYTDNGTFQVTDDLLLLNFRSSDLYGHLHQDSTYTIDVVGWRVGFLSMYKNIIKIHNYEP